MTALNVASLIEAHAKREPDSIALVGNGNCMTYGTLNRAANHYARLLQQRGAGPSTLIGLSAERSSELVVGLLAILKSGAAYVGIDHTYPAARIAQVISDARLDLLVVCPQVHSSAQLGDTERFSIDLDDSLSEETGSDAGTSLIPGDTATVVYTSGSGGKPKGVLISHRAILSRASRFRSYVPPAGPRLWRTSLSVIAHVSNLLVPLAAGQRLVIGSREIVNNAQRLAGLIQQHGIPWISLVPSQFRALLESGDALNGSCLQEIVLSGEPLTPALIRLAKSRMPNLRIVNAYGLTETTGLVSQAEICDPDKIVIGSGLNANMYILDQQMSKVTLGDVGELCIAGPQLASGYLDDPELTRERFVPNPYGVPGERMCRTGDLARCGPDGLQIVGRMDRQVKIRGFRVNLAEVESVLEAHESVDRAVVVPKENYLEAYVSAGSDVSAVRAYVNEQVPSYMVPRYVSVLHEFPLLPNGKIDRRALAAAAVKPGGGNGAPPSTLTSSRAVKSISTNGRTLPPSRAAADLNEERRRNVIFAELVRVFQEVLNVTDVLSTDSLFSLGGDSLQAVIIAAKLEARLGRSASLTDFEGTERLAETAARLASQDGRCDSQPQGAGDSGNSAAARPVSSKPNNVSISERAAIIEQLLEEGQLEAARAEARDLSALSPGLRYAETIVTMLDQMPQAGDGHPVFHNDPAKEVQIVRSNRHENIILLFCGIMHALGAPLPVMHRFLGRLPATLVYLRDFRRIHYLQGLSCFGANRSTTVAGLRALIEELGGQRVVCIGNSVGSLAALQYGLELNAAAVVTLSGAFDFSHEFNAHLRGARLARRLSLSKTYRADLVDFRRAFAAAASPPHTLMLYGDGNLDDRLQARYLSGSPRVRLLPLENYSDHNVVPELIRRGWLGRILDWAVNPDDGLSETIPAYSARDTPTPALAVFSNG